MHELAYEETLSCVQCGYCLPVCPTYLTFNKETHSPRGRINLVKMAAEGKLTSEDIEEAIDLCLGCRACETACPTNVPYGKILESAHAMLHKHKENHLEKRVRLVKSFLFDQVIPNEKLLNLVGTSISIYQKTGIQKIAQTSKVLNVLPESLKSFELILPKVQSKRNRKSFYPSMNQIEPLKIGFFTGCIMDTMFARINTQSMELLQLAGCEITVIKEQGCCGALHQHNGKINTTVDLAKKNIEAFEKYDFDYVVNSIGGCGAMLVEYGELFKTDSDWSERAKRFSEKAVDISVIFEKRKLPFTKELSYVVTYQPSCHMTNVQKRVDEPLNVLKSIPGIKYMPLPNEHLCCGSAGIYNIVNYSASMQILDKKMTNVKELSSSLSVIVTTNPGCHLQMKLGIEREGLTKKVRAIHLVELLAEACGLE